MSCYREPGKSRYQQERSHQQYSEQGMHLLIVSLKIHIPLCSYSLLYHAYTFLCDDLVQLLPSYCFVSTIVFSAKQTNRLHVKRREVRLYVKTRMLALW